MSIYPGVVFDGVSGGVQYPSGGAPILWWVFIFVGLLPDMDSGRFPTGDLDGIVIYPSGTSQNCLKTSSGIFLVRQHFTPEDIFFVGVPGGVLGGIQ